MAKLFTTFESQEIPRLTCEIVVKSSATLDEEGIQRKIISSGKIDQFAACAVQLAVVGFTRDALQSVQMNGEDIDIEDFFNDNDVYYTNDPGTSLSSTDLTPKRIMRVYRWHISDWIKRTGKMSFLLRKYGDRSLYKFKTTIFPGAEHLVETSETAKALLVCYKNMDSRLGTRFEERVTRVLQARGLLDNE